MASWFILSLFYLFFIFNSTLAYQTDSLSHQRKQNDHCFTDLSDLLAFRLYTVTKSNNLEIVNGDDRLVLKPNGQTNLGVGFNFKSLGFGIAFGFPKSDASNNKYVKTNRFDFQFTVYSNKIGIDGFFQLYKGYYNSNPGDFLDWNEDYFPKVKDLRVISIGISAFYIFNSDCYSYKAAFVRNQVQEKSAGSFILGIFGYHDEANTDNGFIPQEYPDSIRNDFDLKAFQSTPLGVSIGYMHTFVFRFPLFINFALIPGFGYKRVTLVNLDGKKDIGNQASGQVLGRLAIGYEHSKFYTGATGSVILRNIKYKEFDIDLTTEQFRIFIGKRFRIHKTKKK